MARYLKTAFTFIHTYILLIISVALPILFYVFVNPPLSFLIAGIGAEVVLFVMYIFGLPNYEVFKKRLHENNFDKLIDRNYFLKTIRSFHPHVKPILEAFYEEAFNITKELNVKGVENIVRQSLLNILQLGESYSSLQFKIEKGMGTSRQREQMKIRNQKRLNLIESVYKELKELSGKLILMGDADEREEKIFIEQISTMNEALESEID